MYCSKKKENYKTHVKTEKLKSQEGGVFFGFVAFHHVTYEFVCKCDVKMRRRTNLPTATERYNRFWFVYLL